MSSARRIIRFTEAVYEISQQKIRSEKQIRRARVPPSRQIHDDRSRRRRRYVQKLTILKAEKAEKPTCFNFHFNLKVFCLLFYQKKWEGKLLSYKSHKLCAMELTSLKPPLLCKGGGFERSEKTVGLIKHKKHDDFFAVFFIVTLCRIIDNPFY